MIACFKKPTKNPDETGQLNIQTDMRESFMIIKHILMQKVEQCWKSSFLLIEYEPSTVTISEKGQKTWWGIFC